MEHQGSPSSFYDVRALQPIRGIMTPIRDRQLAYLFLRLILGLNIFLHGLSRILAGTMHFATSLIPEFAKTPLADWAVYDFGLILPWAEAAIGLILPWAEAAIGLLLLLGLFTRWVLIAGSLLMLLLTFGTSLRQDWSIAAIQLTYAVIYAALLAFREYNHFAADAFLQPRPKPQAGFSA